MTLRELAVHVHEWRYSIHDAIRWCRCGAEEDTPVESEAEALEAPHVE